MTSSTFVDCWTGRSVHIADAAKRRLGRIAFLVFPVFGTTSSLFVARAVVDLLFELSHGVGITGIKEGDQTFDFRGCLLPQLGDSPEGFFTIAPLSGKAWGNNRASGPRWHSCAILRINLSHDSPHSLGQARRCASTRRRAACFSSVFKVPHLL
jgi:hypothetical protein